MWRLGTIAVALAGLPSMAGCGLMPSRLDANEAHAPGALTRPLDAPVGRALAAALAVAGPDFLFDVADFEFPVLSLATAGGRKPQDDKGAAGSPAASAEIPLAELNLGSGRIVGKTKDGRPATLWIVRQEFGKKCEVSVRIGKPHGPGPGTDSDLVLAFFGRIEHRLAHPESAPKGESAIVISFDEPIARALKDASAPDVQKGADR